MIELKFEKVSFYEFAKHFPQDNHMDIKLMYDNLKLPKRATKLSAGYDIFAPYDFILRAGDTIKIPTGIRCILDDDKFLAVYPRSGLGFKYKLQLYNSVGIIDSDFCQSESGGHIWIKLYNASPEEKALDIKQGDAFCQGIIQQYFLVDDDSRTEGNERTGGFGSTG